MEQSQWAVLKHFVACYFVHLAQLEICLHFAKLPGCLVQDSRHRVVQHVDGGNDVVAAALGV
jgi:hypothetical protein